MGRVQRRTIDLAQVAPAMDSVRLDDEIVDPSAGIQVGDQPLRLTPPSGPGVAMTIAEFHRHRGR